MPTPSLTVRKQRLRQTMQRVCTSVSSKQALSAGEAIADRMAAWSGWQTSSSVALFATLEGEVNTAPLIQLARREGKQVLFPRMLPERSLEFAFVAGDEGLQPGRHGVREPGRDCPARSLFGNAIVFVPGVAFDRQGGRLGRGAGYYDRALAGYRESRERPRLIGVGFASQILDSVPLDLHDVRMDGVVTESGFFEMDSFPVCAGDELEAEEDGHR